MQLKDPEKIEYFLDEKFKDAPFHLYWKNKKDQYLGCNQTQALTAGFSKQSDMVNQTDLAWVTPECARRLNFADKKVMAENKGQSLFEHVLVRNKFPLLVLSHKIPLYTRSGKTAGIVGLSILIDKKSILPAFPFDFNETDSSTLLSLQQEDCLFYLIQGMTHKQIAKKMQLAPKTIEHYLDAVKMKLNCDTRQELIAMGLKLPIIKLRLALD